MDEKNRNKELNLIFFKEGILMSSVPGKVAGAFTFAQIHKKAVFDLTWNINVVPLP